MLNKKAFRGKGVQQNWNVESAKIIYDDSELCTRAYYEVETTTESGEPSSEWRSLDADTLNTYGVVEREVPTGAGYTANEALYAAQEYLRKHKKPRVSIEISGQDLSQITGESLDTFTIGKLFRLSLVDYDLTIEDVITGLSWNDVYGNPTEVTVNLADEEDTAVVYIHDIESTGGRSGGGGGGKKRQEDTFKEYYTRFTQTDYLIDLEARHVAENGSILQQAGMYLDANGVLQYAIDNEKNVGARIKTQADRISLVVEGTGTNAHIKPAEIVAAINNGASSIKISADHIELDGETLATILYGQELTVTNMNADYLVLGEDGLSSDGGASFTGTVSATEGFSVNGEDIVVADITFSGNTMTVSYTDGREPVNFSKAVSLPSGTWIGNVTAGKSFQYQAKQNNVVVGTGYSPAVDSIYRYANVVWDADYKGFSVKLRAQDANGTDLIEEEITFDTTRSFNAGKNSVTTIAPTSINVYTSAQGTTLGTRLSASILTSGKYITFAVGNTTYSIPIT